MFGSAWCLVMAKIQFSLIKKIKIGHPEHLLTPQLLITSHFCLTPPHFPSKWTLCLYHPLNKSLDLFGNKYERLLFSGDFNAGMEDSTIKIFRSKYNLTSMTNKSTFYKNPDRPTCINLSWTNCPGSFRNSCVIETCLSDFHNMIVTVVKTS